MDRNLSRVGIFRIGHLGDMVVALPALWTIRKYFADAEITLLSKRRQVGTLAQSTDILRDGLFYDRVVAYDIEGARSFTKIWAALRELRKSRLQVMAYLPTDARTPRQMSRDALFFKIAGVKKIVGMDGLRRAHHRPTGIPLPKTPNETDNLLGYLALDGIQVDTPPSEMFDLGLTAEERRFAEEYLAKNGAWPRQPGKPLVGLTPGSKMEAKLWPIERYRHVASELSRRTGARIVSFGSPAEREICDEVTQAVPGTINGAGELTVRQAAAVLEKLDMYLGNDTGTMHVASAVGLPCVGIFSARDWPNRWHPYGDRHTVLRSFVPCEGCLLETCNKGNLCLTQIGQDQVLADCLKHLHELGY